MEVFFSTPHLSATARNKIFVASINSEDEPAVVKSVFRALKELPSIYSGEFVKFEVLGRELLLKVLKEDGFEAPSIGTYKPAKTDILLVATMKYLSSQGSGADWKSSYAITPAIEIFDA